MDSFKVDNSQVVVEDIMQEVHILAIMDILRVDILKEDSLVLDNHLMLEVEEEYN